MNILILGSGGREHALAWKIKQSPLCDQLFIAPGNGGTSQFGINVHSCNDFDSIETFIRANSISLVVIGPEDPLVNGLVDFLYEANSRQSFGEQWTGVIGPSKFAAQLEGSKAFAKEFMLRQHIPTATYEEFTIENYQTGKTYLQHHSLPIVLKADGLAAGKGVVICQTHEEALQVFEEMILHKQFGEASARVVVEQFLDGIEVSVFALTDGKTYQVIGHAKDYKRIGVGDTGANTGGMGCVSPVPFMDEVFMQKVVERIIEPTINGFYKEAFDYNGFVFFGLIKVGEEPYVIEYNCRMGDPETEVVLPLLENDLVQLFTDTLNGNLGKAEIQIARKSAATVMAVSGGYPGDYQKHIPMHIPQELQTNDASTIVFHAGTKVLETGQLVTNGGRVITVTSLADDIQSAAAKSKEVIEQIAFDGKYYRKDIGYEFE
ncbi:MAG: phosphoribosylamine--glycine ligase [Bacteroidota bacterium]